MSTNETSHDYIEQAATAESPNPPGPSVLRHWADALTAVGVWLLSMVFLLVIPILGVLPYVIYMMLVHGSAYSQALATDKTMVFISILGVVPAHAATLAVIWFVVTRKGQIPFRSAIKLEWPKSLGPAFGTAFCVVVAVALLGFGIMVTHFFGGQKTDVDLLVESSTQARWATAIMAFLTAPLVEEALYRGLLYQTFEKAFDTVGNHALAIAAAVSTVSIMFAGVHVLQYRNNLAVISVITLLSVSLTLIRAFSGKLMPCFVIHLIFNGIQSVVIVAGPYLSREVPTPPVPAPSLSLLSHIIHLII